MYTLEKKKVMKDKKDIQGMTELQDTACRKKKLTFVPKQILSTRPQSELVVGEW